MHVIEPSRRKGARSQAAIRLPRPASAGFTFIETMVALAILAIGMAGVYRVLLMAMQSRQAAQYHYTAAIIANNRVEFAKNLPLGNMGLLVESWVAVDELGLTDVSGEYRRSTTIENTLHGDPDLSRIAVTVWSPTFIRSETNRLSVTVSTILTTYNSP